MAFLAMNLPGVEAYRLFPNPGHSRDSKAGSLMSRQLAKINRRWIFEENFRGLGVSRWLDE